MVDLTDSLGATAAQAETPATAEQAEARNGGASGGKGKGGKGGHKLTAEQRTESRERSKERRAQTVASNLKDSENLKRYDETARATDPSNNFNQLKSCAQKLNYEFKKLDKKAFGTKFISGPFKRKNEKTLTTMR